MKLKIVILSILIIPIMGVSQSVFSTDDFVLDSNKMVFGIRSEVYNNSNSLTAVILNSAFYGGYISREDRQHILSRTREVNNSGVFWNNSLFFAHRIDTLFGKKRDNLSHFVNINDKQENMALFSKNATELLLFGNKSFAGKSAALTPLSFKSFHYTQFQWGLSKTYESGNYFSVGVSFLYGQTNKNLKTDRFDVLVSEYGDRISVDADFMLQESDINNTQFMAYNGAGASIDFVTKFKMNLLKDSSNLATFHFSVTDLGFISWNGTSTETKADTFYTYNGVTVDKIFNPSASTSGNQPNEIWDSVSTQRKTSYITIIPSTIHFYLEQEFKKWNFKLGGAHRLNAFYYPFFYGKAGRFLTDKILLSGQLNYGGYGNFGGGLEIKYITPTFDIKLGSTNLEGFITPTKLAGQSVYLQMRFKL